MLYGHETVQLKPSTSKGEMRACVTTSRHTLEELTVFIRQSTVPSLYDSDANTQLMSAWVCYITHVLNTVLTGKLCETKLANQVCSVVPSVFFLWVILRLTPYFIHSPAHTGRHCLELKT